MTAYWEAAQETRGSVRLAGELLPMTSDYEPVSLPADFPSIDVLLARCGLLLHSSTSPIRSTDRTVATISEC
ncbi:hypothetical protein [Cryptosporangium minutisporangium]